MDILEALILGIIQGLTEFLPVSSSGHLELGKVLLDIDLSKAENNLLFTIVVHGATALSTIVVYRRDLRFISRELLTFRYTDSTNFLLFIMLSMIPAGLVGYFLKEEIESFFSGNILLVGTMLLLTGFLLLLTNLVKPKRGILNFKNSLAMGIAQALAILPGVSRSGTTIATGVLLGIRRDRVARFSFLMVIPLIIGVMIKELKDYSGNGDVDVMPLIIGFIAAFISGLLACKWMIRIVKKSKLIYFAYYCFAVGITAIIASQV